MRRRRFLVFASALVLIGCILAIALLGLAELTVRVVSDVNLNGTSADLFTPDRFGPSRGNTPNISAVSFGTVAFIDANGFRVPSHDYQYPEESEDSVLILGDSAPFGLGVDEPETYVGLLRTQYPKVRVYNASVIGHGLPDYLNVVTAVLQKTTVSKVLLFFCLNDISTASAAEIEKAITKPSPVSTPPAAAFPPASTPAGKTTAPVQIGSETAVRTLRTVGPVAALNDFLRDKSKLYLLIKGTLTDPARRYFLSDYQNYLDHESVVSQLQPLATIAATLKKRNVEFAVVLAPYEYQLRQSRKASDPADVFLPQREVGEFLKAQGIPFFDTSPELLALAIKRPQHYFLSFDPMHLSPLGHAEMFKILQAHGLAKVKKVSSQ